MEGFMQPEIYYFSATGNSLFAAKKISDNINGKIISVPKVLNSGLIKCSSSVIGIVFPDYHSNLPDIIRRFISKLQIDKSIYIFGIATYGGSAPGITIKSLKDCVEKQGGLLSFGFAVKMPYNYIIPYPDIKNWKLNVKLNPPGDDAVQDMLKKSKIKIDEICSLIKNRQSGIYENTSEFLFKIIGKLNLKNTLGRNMWLKLAGYKGRTKCTFNECIKIMDYGFSTDDKCTGCRSCFKICPVNNITMKNNKPSWLHNCEQCFACLQWCPEESIQFGGKTIAGKRYRNPEIKYADLLLKDNR